MRHFGILMQNISDPAIDSCCMAVALHRVGIVPQQCSEVRHKYLLICFDILTLDTLFERVSLRNPTKICPIIEFRLWLSEWQKKHTQTQHFRMFARKKKVFSFAKRFVFRLIPNASLNRN